MRSRNFRTRPKVDVVGVIERIVHAGKTRQELGQANIEVGKKARCVGDAGDAKTRSEAFVDSRAQ